MPINVTLTLKGLLVLDAKVNRTTGKVGILPAPPLPTPAHELLIKVTRHPPAPPPPPTIIELRRPNISSTLSLEIAPATTRFTIHNPNPINRHQAGAAAQPDGEAWFVNLENHELFGKRIGADSTKLESVLTINGGGELFTADPPNESILRITRPGHSEELFGRVALKLGITFSGTKAVFKNGATTVFDSSAEPTVTSYDIEIIHDALTHPPIVEDANNYYTVLGTLIGPGERILFRSVSEVRLLQERLEAAIRHKDSKLETDLRAAIDMLVKAFGPPAGPEAACFPAYLGTTDL